MLILLHCRNRSWNMWHYGRGLHNYCWLILSLWKFWRKSNILYQAEIASLDNNLWCHLTCANCIFTGIPKGETLKAGIYLETGLDGPPCPKNIGPLWVQGKTPGMCLNLHMRIILPILCMAFTKCEQWFQPQSPWTMNSHGIWRRRSNRRRRRREMPQQRRLRDGVQSWKKMMLFYPSLMGRKSELHAVLIFWSWLFCPLIKWAGYILLLSCLFVCLLSNWLFVKPFFLG